MKAVSGSDKEHLHSSGGGARLLKPSRETGHPTAAQLTEKLVRARTTIYSGAERRLSSESAQILGKMLLESFSNQQIQLDPTTMSGRESNNNTPSVIGTV